MRLLHISDIHFKAPQCLDPHQDEDLPVRTRLIEDVGRRVAARGPVSAILLGGDVAYKGAPEEYKVAGAWLDELAAVAGCPPEEVYVVPGNHDVDRAKCRAVQISNAHRLIKSKTGRGRSDELYRQLRDPAIGAALLEPIAAYNEFAKRYDCEVTATRTAWTHDFEMADGIKLRLRGLTSTLLSGADGNNDYRRDLCVGPWQTAINPSPNIIDLVMCHHPFDWLDDGEAVEDVLRNRAPLQVFGHRHRSRPDRDVRFLRFHAGAVNPDRDEDGWRPCYNLFDVGVVGTGAARSIEVTAEILELQDYPETFREVVDEGGNKIWHHRISWPDSRPVPSIVSGAGTISATALPNSTPLTTADIVPVKDEELPRDLVHMFWSKLTVSQRWDVVAQLNLLESHEQALPEHCRYDPIWGRARELNLIPRLASAIKSAGRK
jgi:predicted MPP superfamily phosphohydrolase